MRRLFGAGLGAAAMLLAGAVATPQAQAQDATFQAYQPGEFSRAPHGQDQNVTPGVGAPSLATESER